MTSNVTFNALSNELLISKHDFQLNFDASRPFHQVQKTQCWVFVSFKTLTNVEFNSKNVRIFQNAEIRLCYGEYIHGAFREV